MSADTENGVWAVVDQDYVETITKVFRTEVEALRSLNERGCGRVLFVPWGSELGETEGDTE